MSNQRYVPIPPPVTWFGSKSRIVKSIVKEFHQHQTFVDVFGGSGAVLLGKPPSKVEVYNDLNGKMVTLFRVLSDAKKAAELKRALELTPYSRTVFDESRAQIDGLTDEIEIAKSMIVIQRQSHGGLGKQWSYCVDAPAAGYSASVRKFHAGIDRLVDVSKRFRKVQVENLDWADVLDRYDREQTLFYLDPPYVPDTRVNGRYEYELDVSDHEALVDKVLSLRGMCVLSGYAHDVYRPLEESGWVRVEIDVVAPTSKTRSKRTECLWISPKRAINATCVSELASPQSGATGRALAAYRTHLVRVRESEEKIVVAIKTLRRIGSKPTKAEVSRMTGISRVHLSRRYSHLWDEE